MHRFVDGMLVLAVLVAACSSPTASTAPSQSAAEPTTVLNPVPPTVLSTEVPTAAPGLRMVTIGDSIPYGRQDCSNCETFTDLFAASTGTTTGLVVEAINLSSHDGLTGARLVARIRTSAQMRDAVAAADIIIVNIGHNDTPWNAINDDCDGATEDFDWASYTGACLASLVERHASELDAILTEVEALRIGKPTAIRVMTDYNDVIGYAAAPPEASEPSINVLDAFSEATCRVAVAHLLPCIDVYHAFNGADGRTAATPLLNPEDHTHPNADGHALIARLLISAGINTTVP